MGILGTILYNIKNISNANKIKKISDEELLKLDDDTLCEKLFNVCDADIVDLNDSAITKEQRIFYTLSYFEMEVNNGGLCQFFVNSSRQCAPYLSHALDIVGAVNIKNLFDNFVKTNHIDLNDLSSFIIEDVYEYEKQTERFDFDSFDEQFYEDEGFHNCIIKYARENITSILNRH